MGRIDERLKQRGIELPTPPVPVANYVGAAVRTGNLLFLAGHTPDHAVDGRRRDADLMVAPQEEAQPHDPVLSFLTDAEDQRLDLRRCAMGTRARPPRSHR